MKKLILAVGVTIFASSTVVLADYNTDAPGKSIRCTAPGMVVVMDRARTIIKETDAIDPGHPEVYTVTQRETDGDTSISYEALNEDDEVVLTFDDQGDTITYDGNDPIALNCPQ